MKCQVPSSLSQQSQMYSAYKSHTTKKGLVAIAPNGYVIFVSQLFCGSISDRELIIQSGLLDLLKLVPPKKTAFGRLWIWYPGSPSVIWCCLEYTCFPWICISTFEAEGCRCHTKNCASSHTRGASHCTGETKVHDFWLHPSIDTDWLNESNFVSVLSLNKSAWSNYWLSHWRWGKWGGFLASQHDVDINMFPCIYEALRTLFYLEQ